MHCRATARSLNSTSGRVSRVRRWATRLVSCLHTWRQTMQAKRRTCAWASILGHSQTVGIGNVVRSEQVKVVSDMSRSLTWVFLAGPINGGPWL